MRAYSLPYYVCQAMKSTEPSVHHNGRPYYKRFVPDRDFMQSRRPSQEYPECRFVSCPEGYAVYESCSRLLTCYFLLSDILRKVPKVTYCWRWQRKLYRYQELGMVITALNVVAVLHRHTAIDQGCFGVSKISLLLFRVSRLNRQHLQHFIRMARSNSWEARHLEACHLDLSIVHPLIGLSMETQ
jgi:hypothetical protein